MARTSQPFTSDSGITQSRTTVTGGVLKTNATYAAAVAYWDMSPGGSSSGITNACSTLYAKPGGSRSLLQFSSDGSTWTNALGDLVSNTGAYSCDGSNDVITVPDNSLLRPGTGNFCWSCWVKFTGNQAKQILTKWNAAQSLMYLGLNSVASLGAAGQKFVWGLWASGGANRRMYASTENYGDGQWHHVFIAAEPASAIIRCYVDGEEVTATNSNAGSWPNVATTASVGIGAVHDKTNPFAGSVDDVRLYQGVVPTAAQVRALYQRHSDFATSSSSRVLWLKLDGNANDSSGNAFHGTIDGPTALSNFYDIPVFGEPIGSKTTYSFDFANDYCSRVDNALFTVGANASVFAWVKTLNSAVGLQTIVSHYVAGSAGWLLGTTAGKLRTIVSADGGTTNWKLYDSVPATLADGLWHHVGFTFAANALKLFIDGAEVSVTKTADVTVNSIHDSTAGISVGATGGSADWFDGCIAGVVIYGSTLTTQIATAFANGWDVAADTIVYWPLAGSGADLGSNNLPLTISGPTAIEDLDRPAAGQPSEETIDLSALGLTTAVYAKEHFVASAADRTASNTLVEVEYTSAANRRRRFLLAAGAAA